MPTQGSKKLVIQNYMKYILQIKMRARYADERIKILLKTLLLTTVYYWFRYSQQAEQIISQQQGEKSYICQNLQNSVFWALATLFIVVWIATENTVKNHLAFGGNIIKMFHSQGKSVLYIIGKRSLYGTCSVGIGYLLLKEQNFHCAITPADHRRKVYGAECLRVLFYLFFFLAIGLKSIETIQL